MGILHSTKKISLAIFTIGLLLFNVLAAALLPSTALASGETYTWKDPKTISITGGSADTGSDLQQVGTNTTSFSGAVSYKSKNCSVFINATISSDNKTAKLTTFKPSGTGTSSPLCGSDQTNQFNNKTVNVNGSRATAVDTSAQDVTIILTSPKPASSSPKSVTFTYEYSFGGQDGSPRVVNASSDINGGGGAPAGENDVYYVDNLKLGIGTYRVCFSALLSGCQSFGVTATGDNTYTYGTLASQNAINVTLKLSPGNVCDNTSGYGPYPITLQSDDGTILKTVNSSTATSSSFGCGSGAGGIVSVVTLTGVFDSVDPGTYKVCLGPSTKICTDATKVAGTPLDVTLSADQAALDAAGIDTSGNSTPSCENSGGALSWIMCSIIEDVASATDGIYDNVLRPLLKSNAIGVDSSDPVYKGWSSFRVYGDIFLVIALLVIVFGQSIGGGVVDAYTAKKILPRLVIAAILINLSIYIVALLVDITNIVGDGISSLLLAPFGLKDALVITHQNSVGSGTTEGLGLAALVAGGIWATLHFGALLEVLFFSVAIPALLTFLAIMVTLLVRKAVITLLVLLSPVAFALYCLPNTEQYFKKWWELLTKALLVYPIVAVLFAMGKILAITIDLATNNPLTPLLEIIATIVPLFLIPFAFQLAGGILGRVHDLSMGARKKLHESGGMAHRRELAKQHYKDQSLLTKERMYDSLNRGGTASRFAARRMGGHNLKAAVSEMNARVGKDMQAQNDTGDDSEQRALTTNKKLLNKAYREAHGIEGTDYRYNSSGGLELRSSGGSWQSQGAVEAAYGRWGHNVSAMQWALGHEMEKANTQEEQDYLAKSVGVLMGGDEPNWEMSAGQRAGLWKGAAFNKQNINRQWKHYGIAEDGNLEMGPGNALSMFREIDEKQGNYAMMQQNADTWTSMSAAMDRSRQLLNGGGGTQVERAQAEEVLERGRRIAFATRSASMAGSPIPGQEGEDAPIGIQQPGVVGRSIGAGAAGRVQEAMIQFTQMSDITAGEYVPPPTTVPSPPRPPVRAGNARSALDRRESDRSGPGAPNGTGTGGSPPRFE